MNLVMIGMKLIATGLVVALDFCMGAFISTLVLTCYGVQPTTGTVFVGGILALLPDLDLWTQFTRKKSYGHEVDHHRTVFHFPIVMVPVVSIVVGLVAGFLEGPTRIDAFNDRWALITILCLVGHYLHDMTGPFGGLFLFWPFSTKSFGVNGCEEEGTSKRERYIRDFGHNVWIRTYWMRISRLSVPELCVASAFAVATVCIDWQFNWLCWLCVAAWAGLYTCQILTGSVSKKY